MNRFSILLGFLLILEIHARCEVHQKCKCPAILNAANGRLGEIESTKYLAYRETFSAGVTVNENCEVSVDISKSTVNNFFLLIVRDPEPPIFFRRFTNSTDKKASVELPDLKCVNDEGTYNWYHDGVKISGDFEVTLLDDEECGCEPIQNVTSYATISQIDGTCGAFSTKCDEGLVAYRGESTSLYSSLAETTAAEFLCVIKSWYYGSLEMNSVGVGCLESGIYGQYLIPDRPKMEKFLEKCPCTYLVRNLNFTDEEFPKSQFWPILIKNYKISEEYHNLVQDIGSITFDETTCSFDMKCSAGATLFIWSMNHKPMIFPPNKASATAQCANMPASTALAGGNVKDYWVNGIQLINFTYGCLFVN